MATSPETPRRGRRPEDSTGVGIDHPTVVPENFEREQSGAGDR